MNRPLPEWLQENVTINLPAPKQCVRRFDYLEKTLQGIYKILAQDAHGNSTAGKRALLQQIEPHAKLIAALILLLAAAWTKKIEFLAAVNLLLLGLAAQAGLGVKSFMTRVWLPAFFFSGLAVLPGIISWVTPGESLYTIYSGVHLQLGWLTFPVVLDITKQGVQSALLVILRSASSLGLATLVLKTTRWSVITKVLAKFGLPAAVVAVLDLTYRYIYLFLLLFLEYIMGRRSRLAGREAQGEKLSWIGGTIADFLRITREYGEDIHYAMQSRGFTGEYHGQMKLKIGLCDIGFLIAAAIICCFA
ncbi:MAG: cobalt ECF transporter T component CbiQ [Pelosinus sp.]|nr:cobalt ECF transporter T component CbiQ [Pelosinus sp.]